MPALDSRILKKLKEAIALVFSEWEKLPGEISKFRIRGLLDTHQNRYTLQHLEIDGPQHIARTLAYLEIRDDKIWTEVDNTEKGIAPDLVAAGIPKDKIVLAFYPPALREVGEFAVT